MQGWGKYQEKWKWEQYIQTNEHMGSLIKLILRWFSQWAISKHFWILWNILLIAALPQSKSPFFCGNPSLIYLCKNRPFRFLARASFFLGCPFFIFFIYIFLLFHYALENLNFVQNEWKILFPQRGNSLTQVPTFDPNGLSKYVM